MRPELASLERLGADVFRVDLERPGFAHLDLGPREPGGDFRRRSGLLHIETGHGMRCDSESGRLQEQETDCDPSVVKRVSIRFAVALEIELGDS